jgi:1,4-dihydroxy-2-naphthoate octaprenyltransferase
MRPLDKHASIAPIIIFFIVIILIGLLHGIFSIMMDAAEGIDDPAIDVGGGVTVDVNSGMNTLMSNAWLLVLVIVLIIGVSWLLLTAQKERYGGGL